MVALLRHRQTKEADNSYARPNATAPHLDSTDQRAFVTLAPSGRNGPENVSSQYWLAVTQFAC